MWDTTGIRIFCGQSHGEGRPLLNAIAAERFDTIKGTLKQRDGDYLYGGRRTATANVADRFAGSVVKKLLFDENEKLGWLRYLVTCFHVWRGTCDEQIVETWHERAGAEHWYACEKQWD